MRIIFMGNSEFAVPSLVRISKSDHKILYVVSNPPKKQGRGKKLKETAVGIAAKAMEISVLQPSKLGDINFLRYISAMQPDIFVVVAYKILPDKLLSIPKYGAINLHPSMLPKYRGAAPIQWALLNGDEKTAISIIALNNKIDSGAIMMQKEVDILTNDDYGSLSDRLSKQGGELVVETLNGIEAGKLTGKAQNNEEATLARKIIPTDLVIDWNRSAIEIRNQIRAFSPFPGAFSTLDGKRIKLFIPKVLDDRIDTNNIGKIIDFSNQQFVIQTGKGQLSINEVQIEGKKRMGVQSFLNGVKIEKYSKLGD